MIHKTAWVLLAAVAYGCGGAGPGGSLPVAPAGAIIDKVPMIVVPAGDFIRGGRSARSEKKVPGVDTKKKKNDSAPVRRIYLDTFRIEKFEVTNAAYARFVAATGHSPPRLARSGKPWGGNWSRFEWGGRKSPPGAGDLPVSLVTWFDAEAYCVWVGKRLPTEAEWEKAARGPGGNIYPWGGEASPGSANFGKKHEGPLPVGSFPSGKSPYGVMDMAGNVAEWVNDYYYSAYYAKSPDRNPRGPRRGSRRVVRGGHWRETSENIRADHRWSGVPSERHGGVGFRCALSGGAVR
jgi:formylglycine-generating enzyme required for sulfatase activity